MPNMRPYSRVNCETLSYPTRYAAMAIAAPSASIARRASISRSCFWYCSGVSDVIERKCAWKFDRLMPAASASRSSGSGLAYALRISDTARAMRCAWLSATPSARIAPPWRPDSSQKCSSRTSCSWRIGRAAGRSSRRSSRSAASATSDSVGSTRSGALDENGAEPISVTSDSITAGSSSMTIE